MFSIGFLLLLAIAIIAINLFTRTFPLKVRPYVWPAVVAFAVSFPFWHYLYPSYREFLALCERSDRYVLLKTVDVDYAYSDSGSFGTYHQHEGRGFKGFDIRRGELGYVRYTRNENWDSLACQRDCANPSSFVWEKTCEVNCFTKTAIHAPEFEYKSSFTTKELVKERLVQQRSAMLTMYGEELSVTLNYIYYPYGTGFATVLGMASGSPPKLTCRTNKDGEMQEFMKPRKTK